MAKVHIVAPGDHLPKIAAAEGFPDAETIWDHPKNAELKASRDDFCILGPGDEVFIPERKPKTLKLATGSKHKFVVTRPRVRLAMVLKDASNTPLANLPCELHTETATFSLVLDGSGGFDQEIPVQSEACKVVIDGEEIRLLVGHLTPIDSPAGWRDRLNNLGYEAGSTEEEKEEDGTDVLEADAGEKSESGETATAENEEAEQEPEREAKPTDPDDDPILRSAIEEFQCDNGLRVTGNRDAGTKAKLLEVHGC